ncbi:MAG: hypothetical protein RJA63_3309 [Pseudomonadota bacterium]|jgi:ElaB/YqjD/DUF883 family membrane-anchored ribosome-binding protein
MSEHANPMKDKLVSDLQTVVSDTEELLKLTAGQTGDKLSELRDRMNGRLAQAKARLAEADAALRESSRKAADATDEYVHQHPWQSVGVAAGVAFLLGLLAGRR